MHSFVDQNQKHIGPRPKTDMVKKSCSYKSITRWNALENQMRSIQDVDAFKKSLKCIFKPRML